VAEFGMLLRNSEHKGRATAGQVLTLARGALGGDEGGYRAEFVRLVEKWQDLERLTASRDR
jgi:Ca-activated chloride channel family protein